MEQPMMCALGILRWRMTLAMSSVAIACEYFDAVFGTSDGG
jgi:hypothetical protein